MKSDFPFDEALQIARYVAAFQVARPDQRAILCREILAVFSPEMAPMAIWIVRLLGSSNTLAQVTELYSMCLNSGFLASIPAVELAHIEAERQA